TTERTEFSGSEELAALAAEAMTHWDASQEALRKGDWEGYGRGMSGLENVLREMMDRKDREQ
ncbi:MAG: hypothetical protein CVV55_03270, partial [Synergistetes bacterium HGW-Synergistetes-2]